MRDSRNPRSILVDATTYAADRENKAESAHVLIYGQSLTAAVEGKSAGSVADALEILRTVPATAVPPAVLACFRGSNAVLYGFVAGCYTDREAARRHMGSQREHMHAYRNSMLLAIETWTLGTHLTGRSRHQTA